MKGIILAGGSGTRLLPLTLATSKQLLPVYDRPMIYYPLALLMRAGIREIAIVTTPRDADAFRRLLGDGGELGIEIAWHIQDRPGGLPQAYTLTRDFLAGSASLLALGDNIFAPGPTDRALERLRGSPGGIGAGILCKPVSDPQRFGIAERDGTGRVTALVEKPDTPRSDLAVTGLYLADGTAPERACGLRPSARGELEIVDLLTGYLQEGRLAAQCLPRETDWFDSGTQDSLLEAAGALAAAGPETRLAHAPEAVAFRNGWIGAGMLAQRAATLGKSSYGRALIALVEGRAGMPFRATDPGTEGRGAAYA
ncbi:MAG: sugar nucleotidyltransferase [Rubricella sp.]